MTSSSILLPLLLCVLPIQEKQSTEIPPIARRLPPVGEAVAEPLRTNLLRRLDAFERKLTAAEGESETADAAIYAKAVRLAFQFDEFYSKDDGALAGQLITEGLKRLEAVEGGKSELADKKGLVVRGYYSDIDGSPQPLGLEIPTDLDLSKPVPLYVWLHGRGDKTTDMRFIRERETRRGQLPIEDGIVLHPFGRQCVGFKSAGEIDVLEAIEFVKSQYNIDSDRIALLGFSMGGAGAWHLGAHYSYLWTCVCPGAGFAETAEYNRLKPADYPASYTQQLWAMYDVPRYTRNLFNVPTLAYSGEEDRQIQAAQVMEKAFQDAGRKLPHEIGPGMGHKYHPDSLERIVQFARKCQAEANSKLRDEFYLQTETLRYPRADGVEALRLHQHWKPALIEAHVVGDQLQMTTTNVERFRLMDEFSDWPIDRITIDGSRISKQASTDQSRSFAKSEAGWQVYSERDASNDVEKQPGLQGPIDDAFMGPFLFVLPTGDSSADRVDEWVRFESQHQIERWQALMRGNPRVKKDIDVTEEDVRNYNLILWGTPTSNRFLSSIVEDLPLDWNTASLSVNGLEYKADSTIPAMIYPNPRNSNRYVVLNSGLTFRENHDGTNSQQNPKLPDWAVIDIRQHPNAETPGKILTADFFDELWQYRPTKGE